VKAERQAIILDDVVIHPSAMRTKLRAREVILHTVCQMERLVASGGK
jgi:hypothetical protein